MHSNTPKRMFLKVCDWITFGFSHQTYMILISEEKSDFSYPLCKISGQTDVMLGRYERQSSELCQQ